MNLLFKPLTAGETTAEIARLAAELTKLQAELLAGKVVTSVASGDVSAGSLVEISIKERIELILARLNELDPTNYPAADTRRVTRTKLVAYGSV